MASATCATATCDATTDLAACCIAPAFVATCGVITDGGGAFASCTGSRVYDSTKAATTSPDDASCCKDTPATNAPAPAPASVKGEGDASAGQSLLISSVMIAVLGMVMGVFASL